MSYLILDPIIEVWADNHSLSIQKQYQDTEVRSITITCPQGKGFQLWVDKPNQSGDTNVHIWDMKKRRVDYAATKASLKEVLDIAYAQIHNWFPDNS